MANLISIVIPIYNVEKYIVNSLNSVLAQSFSEIEVILIDDGSTDGSGEISDRYAAQDSRVKVYHIPNGGVAKARQMGVESATGEFIAFVDPDDILPHDAIERLYAHMSDDIDIVAGSSTRFYESGKIRYVSFKDRFITHDEWLKMIITATPDYITPPWGKIYRKSLFTESSFPHLKRGQDWMMNIEVAARVRGVKMISDIVYNYRSPFGTGRTAVIDLEHTKRVIGVIENILTSNGLLERCQHELRHLKLTYISKCISNKQYIDKHDEWIEELNRSTKVKELCRKDRRALKALSSLAAQRRFRKRIKFDEFTKKISRWTYIYMKRRPRRTI